MAINLFYLYLSLITTESTPLQMNGNKEINEPKAKPLLRWAGGKTWFLKRIVDFIPTNYNNYFEPFLGGASVFQNISSSSRKFILSDLNEDLINFYIQVQLHPYELLAELGKYRNEESFFYKVRAQQYTDKIQKAARFYYLNRTCFNGIYRVNRVGQFNVPYGYREVSIIEEDSLLHFHTKLKKARLETRDFEDILEDVKPNDLVFLDPPYTVAHNNNGFIEYNQRIFSWNDQERLAGFLENLLRKHAYFIMTNACHDSIKKLYKNIGKHYEIDRYSTISGNKESRNKISELVITNCL